MKTKDGLWPRKVPLSAGPRGRRWDYIVKKLSL